jgi:hypothetical protein
MLTDQNLPPAKTEASPAPSLKGNLRSIAQALGLTLGDAPEAALAFSVQGRVEAAIAPVPVVAPGQGQRLAVILRIAEAGQVPPAVWIGALSEAAGWGLADEGRRFVVLDGHFALLWTTPPLAERELLERLDDLLSTALALAEMAVPGDRR